MSFIAPAQFIYASAAMLNAHAASRADSNASIILSGYQGIKPAMQHVMSLLNAGYKEAGAPLTVGFSSNGPGINISMTIEMTDDKGLFMAELRMLFTYLPILGDVALNLKRIEVDTPAHRQPSHHGATPRALLHARLEQTDLGTSLYVQNYLGGLLGQKLKWYLLELQEPKFSHFDGPSMRAVANLYCLLDQRL